MLKNKINNRLSAPLVGNFSIFTKSNLKISTGYEQILFEKKPVLEILPKQVILDNLEIPFHQRWREHNEKSKHIEYRSKDLYKVKILFDKNKNRFYVSAFDVVSVQYPEFVRRKK
jgi:hypothetical protein